ncbi:DUF2637 domain-containing protein [Streptomyces sp. NPDC000070]|uniref:DUF2637 domain-containing protein n=1 Tax=Streptomyces sp. NPDC000070 TaxID=3154240 RepID=UPI00333240F9
MRTLPVRVDAVLVQAVIAAALSFAHLHDLALAAGQDGWKAWAYPISVDLLLVAAWRRLRSGESKTAGWCWFLVALTASLGANVATAGLLDLENVPAWLRILVAGWPAVAFLGGTLLAHGAAHPSADRATAPEPPSTAQAPEPTAADIEPPTATPELPATAPESAPPPPSPVPPALVTLARKVADEHRARTGTDIDTSTLRARLGVPMPLAEAITTQLT